jgi:hypothetical protein
MSLQQKLKQEDTSEPHKAHTNLAPPPGAQPKRSWLDKFMRVLGFTGAGFVLLLVTLWAVAALYFDVRIAWLRVPMAIAFPLALLAIWIFVKGPWLKVAFMAVPFVLVLGWWLSLRPSNDRDWQPDGAVLPYAEINGNQITLHNIRNCDYRTETDFDVRHYDKTFDLETIRTADLFMVYWGSPYMAHTMMSFGLDDGEYVCFSIETRKEKGEGYSAVKGLFRQFEFTFVVADERDLVRLRTNYRHGEEVYLYRLRASPEQVRKFFLEYLRHMNSLRARPEWYNAITDNCTTGIRMQRAAVDRAPWDWRMLVNGYGNELLYERALIATNLPVAELKERCHINAGARALTNLVHFSSEIRQGLPGINQ